MGSLSKHVDVIPRPRFARLEEKKIPPPPPPRYKSEAFVENVIHLE